MVARLMNATIWPTVVNPCIISQTPVTRMATRAIVELERVTTVPNAHQVKTGICAFSIRSIRRRSAVVSSSARVKLWIAGMLPSTSETRSATWLL